MALDHRITFNFTYVVEMELHPPRIQRPLGINEVPDRHSTCKSTCNQGARRVATSVKARLTQLTDVYLVTSDINNVACLKDLKELVIINLCSKRIRSLFELPPVPAPTHLHTENTLIEDLSTFTG
jgi:hypothetical protein